MDHNTFRCDLRNFKRDAEKIFMDNLNFDKTFLNGTVNNSTTEEGALGRRPVTTLIIYGTMALFWFLYIVFLYKLCRCYIKDKWRKEEARILEARRKKMMTIRNGHCFPVSEKIDEALGEIDQNEAQPASAECKNKEQKELKVEFNLPERDEEKTKNYNDLVVSPSKIGTEIPKIDFVEYI